MREALDAHESDGRPNDSYATLVNSLGGIVWEADGETFQFSFVSPQAETVLGYPVERWLREPDFWRRHTHPDDVDWCSAFCADTTARGQDHEFEYRMIAADGRTVWLHDLVTVRREAGGSVRLRGIMIDVSERKRMEQQLAERLRFETLLTELSATFARVPSSEVDREIEGWLGRLVEFLDVDRSSFFKLTEGGTKLDRTHSYARPGIAPQPPTRMDVRFPWMAEQLRLGNLGNWPCVERDLPPEAHAEQAYALEVGAKSGLIIPVAIGGSVICAISFMAMRSHREWPPELVARLTLVGQIFANALARRRADEALCESEARWRATSEQLRALSASLQSAREEERARIAREIHDELGSALTSLRWDIDAVAPKCPEKAHAMIDLIDTTILTLRRISSELRPSVLDDLGLLAAIAWQAREFQARTDIRCQVETAIESVALDSERSTAGFRVLQEALTNILRHAHATSVLIRLEADAGDLVLTVRDDGRGITESERTSSGSLGLLGIRERAALVGGTVRITGVPGAGTTVEIRIPLGP
jgi:PAS domain S-box-containing protein